MRQWEIYLLDLPNLGSHYVVVISADWVCCNGKIPNVNVLLCATIRAGDHPSQFETGLHDSEGFEYLTGCQCHWFLSVVKSRFDGKTPTGRVSANRRDDVKLKIRRAFQL